MSYHGSRCELCPTMGVGDELCGIMGIVCYVIKPLSTTVWYGIVVCTLI